MTGPANVLELAARVDALADRVQDVSAENTRSALAQDRHIRLADATRDLITLREQVQELNQLGTEWPETSKLSSFQVSKISRDEEWLVSPAGLSFLDALASIIQAVGHVVEDAWEERTDENASSFPDKATLRLLRERGGDDETLGSIDIMEHLSDDFDDLRRKPRPESGDANTLIELESRVAAAWDRVRAGGELSTDRLELLRSVNSAAGKPLSDLSEEDLLWLKNSGTAWSLIIRRRS